MKRLVNSKPGLRLACDGTQIREDIRGHARRVSGQFVGQGESERIRQAKGVHMSPMNSNNLAAESVTVAAEWDAGDLACGELVLELLQKMRALPPGAVLKLIATDPAARIDIAAWCRVTKNPLVAKSPPVFFIQRKEG